MTPQRYNEVREKAYAKIAARRHNDVLLEGIKDLLDLPEDSVTMKRLNRITEMREQGLILG